MEVGIGNSLRFGFLLGLVSLATVLTIASTKMPIQVKLILLSLFFASMGLYLFRDVLLRFPHSWTRVLIERDSVLVTTRSGGRIPGRLERSTLVWTGFVLLRVKPEGQMRSHARLIFPDSLEPGQFRELCVYLKFS